MVEKKCLWSLHGFREINDNKVKTKMIGGSKKSWRNLMIKQND